MSAGRIRILALLAILVLALGLRTAYAMRHPDHLMGDGATYHRLARHLVEEGYLGYSPDGLRSWRPPLYPTWLAGVYLATGRRPLHGKLADIALAGLVVVLIAWLGRRLGAPSAGLVGALAYALHGYEIRHSTDLYPETLIAVLVTLLVLLECRPGAEGRWRSLAHGVLAGLLLHLQPALATIPVLLAARRILRGRARRRAAAAGLLLAGTVLALVPWTLRNSVRHGGFVFVTTNGGFNLLRGHNDLADGDRLSPEGNRHVQAITASAPPDLSEPEFDRWLRGQALRWIGDHPGRAVGLSIARMRYWWLPRHLIEPGSHWPVTYGVIFPFAVLGLAALIRRRAALAPVVLTIVAASIPSTLVVYAGQRYRSPVLPLIALLAGFGVVAVVSFVRERVRRSGGR